jgi:membrane protease YdiL (CAAX protease family)
VSLLSSASPRRAALALGAAAIVLTVVGALTVTALVPAASAWAARLVVVLVLAAAVTGLLAATRGWRAAGFNARVRQPRLLALPTGVALVPLVGGVHLPGAGLLAVLVAGYATTAYAEEALYRGVVLGLLRPAGVRPAVLTSSALFACAHLPNVLFGQAPVVTLAQAVGTFCFGVGYAAVRLRTGSVLPLMALHFLTDLLLRVDALPAWGHWSAMVGGDTVLLVLGLVLLRGDRSGAGLGAPSPGQPAALRADA